MPSGKWRGLGTSMTSKAKGKTEIPLQLTDLIRRDWDGWVPEWIDTDKRLQLLAGDEIRKFFAMIGEFKKQHGKNFPDRNPGSDDQPLDQQF